MKRLKWIYICDHCSAISLPDVILSPSEAYSVLPEKWGEIGRKMHLCPKCYEAYKNLRGEDKDE